MTKNVGTMDRMARAIGGGAMIASAALAPVSLPLLLGGVAMGGYLLATSLAGTCLGYLLMGKSTCPLKTAR